MAHKQNGTRHNRCICYGFFDAADIGLPLIRAAYMAICSSTLVERSEALNEMGRINNDGKANSSPTPGASDPPSVPRGNRTANLNKTQDTSSEGEGRPATLSDTLLALHPTSGAFGPNRTTGARKDVRLDLGSKAIAHAEQEQMKSLVLMVAGYTHDVWRAPRRIADSDKFDPRWKAVADKGWIEKNRGETCLRETDDGRFEVDIANLTHEKLPPEHQEENNASAKIAVGAILQAAKSNIPLDDALIEEIADTVHKGWLERNSAWASDVQKKPYAELPESEKEKDRHFVQQAIEMFWRNPIEMYLPVYRT